MNNTETDLIREIMRIIWDSNAPDRHKLDEIEGLLYQWEQMLDARSVWEEETCMN